MTQAPSGALYVVATPIGNLGDMTLRAVEVLKAVDLIAAEDTRHTRRLLSHYSISTRMKSCHEHNEKETSGEIIDLMRSGKDVAIVTDAGTPGISDPGYRLVRSAVEAGIRVVPVPGPVAFVAALSASGLPADAFTFLGFLPRDEGARSRALSEMKGVCRTHILYESPKRLKRLLSDMAAALGPATDVVVARELTKVHEEISRGTVESVLKELGDREVLGEVTVMVRPAPVERRDLSEDISSLLEAGLSLKDAVKAVSLLRKAPRSDVYAEALKVKAETDRR